MRAGWSIKDAAHVLGIHPKKVPQAIDPALRKVAILMAADPVATLLELVAVLEALKQNDNDNGKHRTGGLPRG